MKNYTINKNTLAIVPIGKKKSKVYESSNVLIINKSTIKIIEESCEYYGSTYEGRKKGTSNLIGITHKPPIIIENSQCLIFFPTASPRIKDCSWISLNNLDTYAPFDQDSTIRFFNNLTIKLPISKRILDNQVLRATRVESVIKKKEKLLESDEIGLNN